VDRLLSQTRVGGQHLFHRLALRQFLQNQLDGNPRASDDGLAHQDGGVGLDEASLHHVTSSALIIPQGGCAPEAFPASGVLPPGTRKQLLSFQIFPVPGAPLPFALTQRMRLALGSGSNRESSTRRGRPLEEGAGRPVGPSEEDWRVSPGSNSPRIGSGKDFPSRCGQRAAVGTGQKGSWRSGSGLNRPGRASARKRDAGG
jgi:hypothetical protein